MPDPMPPSLPTAGARAEAHGLEIRLFGPMDVRIGPRPLPRLRSRKGLWLLALLALRAERPVERDWLAGTLWPEADLPHARRNLRQSLYDLRLALGSKAWRLPDDALRTVRLDMSGAAVDVLAFDAAVARGDLESLETAVSLYRGPLLEGCIEEWALSERRQREEVYMTALQQLAADATARQDHAAAASYLRQAVSADPYREELQRALMEALVQSGNPAGAVAAYGQFSTLLAREMATEPEEETAALFRRLCSEMRSPAPSPAADPPDGPPALSATPLRRSHLPRPLSQFVGREQELRAIGACLANARLVTLTGTGGIGKTRLAIRAAEEREKDHAEEAWLVDLAALADPALVPQAVARALRVHGAPGSPPIETLAEALRDRQLLLLIDNCEHLIDACAHLVEALLSTCPHLRVLATSRQPLGLSGETVWPVPPLSVPGIPGRQQQPDVDFAGPEHLKTQDHRQQQPAVPPEHLMQYSAIRLFVERAGPAGFSLSERNAAAAAQVCRWLDGIPLAIELAAARLRVLSLDQIAARLDDRFQLLTGGSRTALPRQQTLRATLDWSYDLLTEPERALLRRLAVFAGGFTLEAAEAVCSDFGFWILDLGLGPTKAFGGPDYQTNPRLKRTAEPPEPLTLPAIQNPKSKIQNSQVLDLLTQVVDRSLVGVERREGTVRYALLETTREYARDRLREAGEEEELRARHAQFFMALAEQAEPELRGPSQSAWLQRLEQEHDNFRAALDWCGKAVDSGQWIVDSPDETTPESSSSALTTNHQPLSTAFEIGLRIGAGLGWFWWMRGYLAEGRARLEALLERSGFARASVEPGGPPEGLGPGESGDGPVGTPPAIRLAQVKVLNAAGMIADEQGDTEAARAFFQASLALARELDDRLGAARALSNLGGLAVQARDYLAARGLYEESLGIAEAIGDQWWTAGSLTNLGRLAYVLRDHEIARALVERALGIQRQLQDRRAIARSLTVLGLVTARMGAYDEAHVLYLESLSIARELGATPEVVEALRALGAIARERGDANAAAAFFEERLALGREVGSAWAVAESLAALALVARDRGEWLRAGGLWAESLTLFQRQRNPRGVAECLEGLASLSAVPGSEETQSAGWHKTEDGCITAARLLGAAEALRDAAGAPIDPRHRAEYETLVATVRERRPSADFEAAWAEGRTMADDGAVALALATQADLSSPSE